MKRQPNLTLTLTAGSLLLVGTLAIAQTTSKTKTGSSSSTQPQAIAVDHPGGNGVRLTTANKTGALPSATTPAAPASAAQRPKKHLAGVKYSDRTNPVKNGGNPLFEPKDK